tara:strand:- start:1078 stop:1977 length:900 start_codon:yes stop_codon:yes gene_type:complete
MKSKAIKGFNPELDSELNSMPDGKGALGKGIAGSPSIEEIPSLVVMDRDSVYPPDPKTNAQIVCTVDRPRSRFSGYSSDTQAGCMDIVVGRLGAEARSVPVDPDFTKDAARIYISQKTDVDTNFKLKEGGVGMAKAKSAVAIKADGVRIIGREGIKIVTGTDKKNSQGGEVGSITGIDIIAGNRDEELEPMVKGNRLTDSLTGLADHVLKLNGIIDHLLVTQMNFNSSITSHFHYSPWYGNATTPSDSCVSAGSKASMDHLQETKRSLSTHKQNVTSWKNNCLCPSGQDFILSRWNKSN